MILNYSWGFRASLNINFEYARFHPQGIATSHPRLVHNTLGWVLCFSSSMSGYWQSFGCIAFSQAEYSASFTFSFTWRCHFKLSWCHTPSNFKKLTLSMITLSKTRGAGSAWDRFIKADPLKCFGDLSASYS